jgi:hypothetical protein
MPRGLSFDGSISVGEIVTFGIQPIKTMNTRLALTTLVGILAFFPLFSMAQTNGCTNIWAINYNPSATVDDGSCEVYLTGIEYNATLDDNIEIGTGISNQHMAIANHGPVQMGIKVNRRFIADVIPTNQNDYHVYTGYSQTSFFDPTPVPGIATWDFIYSFNLGPYDFTDLTAFVSIDFDPLDTEIQAAPYNLNVSFVLAQLGQSGLSFRQGSENLGFNFWQALAGPTAGLFDPLSPGVYDLGLRLVNLAGQELAAVSIRVIADEPVDGCTDAAACNYNPLANVDDASCTYAGQFTDCAGNCTNDFNMNGICDEEEIFGCVYSSATNFNPSATADNGSCEFTGTGDLCSQADFNASGDVDIADLLSFLTVYGENCSGVDMN